MKKLFFLFLLLSIFFISCYITPESDQEGNVLSLRLPADSIPQREIGEDEAGFLAIITNVNFETEEVDESFFDNPENALYVEEVAISTSSESTIMNNLPIDIRLEKVPEGDKMYIYLYYLGSLTYDYPFGFFYSETPFSIKKGEITYVELTGYVFSYSPEV
ncbi:MAG: hypothetical protein H7A26_01820 [Spirochaetales bacterium]|nr:hypothetical protein [Spirochaetales bacterium]